MADIREILRNNLIYFTKKSGLSQKDLADRLEVTQSAVSHWFKGDNSPNIEVVATICDILNVSLEKMLSPRSDWGAPKEKSSILENPENEDCDEDQVNQVAQWLQQYVIDIGWVKKGEELSDKQFTLLQAIIVLLDAGFDAK